MTDAELLFHLEREVAAKPTSEIEGRKALASLKDFIGPAQRRAVLDGMRGEEKQFFFDKMKELAHIVETMPKTGETDGQGDDAIIYLHYFAGSQANFYIREKDIGCEDSPGQHQAFGTADLFNDGGELGYISIAEIVENRGELDFHWRPRPWKEVKDKA